VTALKGSYQVDNSTINGAEVDRWRKLCAAKAKPISGHGGARLQSNVESKQQQGNSSEYLLGRLKRDHPEIVST